MRETYEKMTKEELLEIIEKAARDGRRWLDLSDKSITALPAQIRQLKNLTTLNLNDNRL